MGRAIAESYGLTTVDTLTGFKFIGEKMKEFEQTGKYSFLFGYEESYGYLIGDFVRDKDAVQACLMAAEVAAYYKSKGKTLYEALMDLFAEYGYYQEALESLTLKGKQGVEQIVSIMDVFRSNPPKTIRKHRVAVIEDYKKSKRIYRKENKQEDLVLPASNVLKYKFENGAWFCLRPSGTEPKIKFYFGVQENSLDKSKVLLKAIQQDVMLKVNELLFESCIKND